MPDETEKKEDEKKKERPWWLRKTELGVGLMIAGAIMHFIPITAPVSGAIIAAGQVLAGVGAVSRFKRFGMK